MGAFAPGLLLIGLGLGTILVSGLSKHAYAAAMGTLAVVGVVGVVATLFLRTEPVAQLVEPPAVGGKVAPA